MNCRQSPFRKHRIRGFSGGSDCRSVRICPDRIMCAASSEEKAGQKYCGAAADGDHKQIPVYPGDDEAYDQGGRAGPDIVRDGDDGGEGHDCQSYIGYII